jgi:uncharacterized protein YdaT
MPWSSCDDPDAMKHLPAPGRDEAVATANALLAGLDEGIAIRTAIAKAPAWAARRGLAP